MNIIDRISLYNDIVEEYHITFVFSALSIGIVFKRVINCSLDIVVGCPFNIIVKLVVPTKDELPSSSLFIPSNCSKASYKLFTFLDSVTQINHNSIFYFLLVQQVVKL